MEKLISIAIAVTFMVIAYSFYELGKYQLTQDLCNKVQYDFCEVAGWKITK